MPSLRGCGSALLRGVIQLGLSLPWVVSAEILRVPADHPTLQGAISAARDGDLIRVSPGTYFERISFEGKAITVASTDGPAVTILDAGGSGTLVRFDRAEGPGSVLQGFTLQNAFESFGAAVTMLGSSPKILGNVFQDNHQSAGGFGAGIGGMTWTGGTFISRGASAGGIVPRAGSGVLPSKKTAYNCRR